jgi:hypothetical protein
MSKVEEIERAVERLPLKELAELAARIDRRRRQLGAENGQMAIRDHSAFLNGYAPEDEGLYDDAPARWLQSGAAIQANC